MSYEDFKFYLRGLLPMFELDDRGQVEKEGKPLMVYTKDRKYGLKILVPDTTLENLKFSGIGTTAKAIRRAFDLSYR